MNKSLAIVIVLFAMIQSSRAMPASVPLDYGDMGVDYAVATSSTRLSSTPSPTGATITTIKTDSIVTLTGAAPSGGWIQGIDFSSGHEGWILASRFKLHATSHPRPPILFETVSTGTTDPPKLTIIDNTTKVVYFHLGDTPEITVQPGATFSLSPAPGSYRAGASAPSLWPSFGEADLVPGSTLTYTVTQVKKIHLETPPSPALLKENQDLIDDTTKEKPQIDAQSQQIAADKQKLDDAFAKYNLDADDLDSKRAKVDNSDQDSVNKFNKLIDALNAEKADYDTLAQKYHDEVAAYNSLVDSYNDKLKRLRDIATYINGTQ